MSLASTLSDCFGLARPAVTRLPHTPTTQSWEATQFDCSTPDPRGGMSDKYSDCFVC